MKTLDKSASVKLNLKTTNTLKIYTKNASNQTDSLASNGNNYILITWDQNGNIKSIDNYANGTVNGYSVNFNESGKLQSYLNYRNNEPYGLALIVDSNENKEISNFKFGLKSGHSITLNNQNDLIENLNIDTSYISYQIADDSILTPVEVQNGRVITYSNGIPIISKYFEEGKKGRDWYYWSLKGELLKKEIYSKDTLILKQEFEH